MMMMMITSVSPKYELSRTLARRHIIVLRSMILLNICCLPSLLLFPETNGKQLPHCNQLVSVGSRVIDVYVYTIQ